MISDIQFKQAMEQFSQLARALAAQTGGGGVQQKHTGSSDFNTMPPPDVSTAAGVFEYRPLYDTQGPFGGFFQDVTLQTAFMNLLVAPQDGLAAHIPVRANNTVDDKWGFLVRYDVQPDGNYSEGEVCDPAIPLTSDYDFMKMGMPYGRIAHGIKTLDMTNLLLRYNRRQFDDFYVFGQFRGVPAVPNMQMFMTEAGTVNTDLIVASAIRRKYADLGTYFQRQILKWAWVGDPAATPGGKQIIQPYGMYRLINGDYANCGLPITTTAHIASADATRLKRALSSIVVDIDGHVVGDGTWSLWRWLIDVEELLYNRAANTGLTPVQWRIYMPSMIWSEIVKHIACEMAADGCTIPNGSGIDKVLNYNDGGLALFNIQARQQLENSMSLTLNGRTYPVVLDPTMPYTEVRDGNDQFLGYKGSIFFIPFTAGGEQVLYWEHVDYSELYSELGPIQGRVENSRGWTDNGYWFHQIEQIRTCWEMQTEGQMRLIFKAPHLAARLDNIVVHKRFQSPQYWNGAGEPTGWLMPPAS